jgi:hypothetical protein
MKEFELVSEYLQENGYTLMHSNPSRTWGNFASLDGRTSVEIIFKRWGNIELSDVDFCHHQ